MPNYFTPPVVYDVPVTVPWPHPANALFRHYTSEGRGAKRGINVYIVGGTVTTIPPYPTNTADATFHGGHLHTVTDAQAALLIAAGYEVVSA